MTDLYELRTYTLSVGAMPRFIAASSAILSSILNEYLTPIATFRSEVGPLNQVISLWRYDSLLDRHERRGALQADPRWATEAGPVLGPLIQSQTSRLYRSTRPWTSGAPAAGPRPFLYGRNDEESQDGWRGRPLDAPQELWSLEPFVDFDAAELAYGSGARKDQILLLPLPHSPWQ